MKNKYFIKFIKLFLVILCFGFLYNNIDTDLASEIIKDINFNYLFPVMIIFLLYLITYSIFIFKIYDNLFVSKLKLNTWIKIFINGNFLNSIPFFGFLYKGYRLNNYEISVKNYLFANVFISWLAISIFFLFYSF